MLLRNGKLIPKCPLIKLPDVAGTFLEASIGHTDDTDLKDKHRQDAS
jgi:hypothetical protein